MSARKVRPATNESAANSTDIPADLLPPEHAPGDAGDIGGNSSESLPAGDGHSIVHALVASAARTEQEQRSALVRDINSRINGLETRIDDMSGDLERSRSAVAGSFATLEKQIHATDALLRDQQSRADQLEQAQQELRSLHEHLDRVRRQQGQAIEALTLDTRRRFEDTRSSLVALHELCHQQKETLAGYRRDHETVAKHARELQWQVDGIDSALGQHEARTERNFRRTGWALVAVATVSLGLIAWYQVYPTAVPETVKTQLATLAGGLDEQALTDAAMTADLARQGSQIAALDATGMQLQAGVDALTRSDARLAAGLSELRHEQTAMQNDLASLRADWHAREVEGGMEFQPLSP